MKKAYFHYWGKARTPRTDGVDAHKHHLLPWHCLDVAACGHQLVMQNRFGIADKFAALNMPDRQQAATFFAWLLCWHDTGKFSRYFQQQYRAEGLVVPHNAVHFCGRHDALGLWLWDEHLSCHLNSLLQSEHDQMALYRMLNRWMCLTFGHHGRPVGNRHCASAFLPEDCDAARLFLQDIRALFPTLTLPAEWGEKPWRKRFSSLSWLISAVVVLADWIGSNTHYFPCCSDAMPLGIYWLRACKQAERAVSQLPVAAEVAPFAGIAPLFPFITTPTPLQQKALQQDISPPGPQLFILEDVTGAGKTEAALILAHRLMAAGKAQGLYIGLPTTATANAMYQRMRRAWRQLYHPGSIPSLMLSHGSSHLSAEFSRSVWHPLANVEGEVVEAEHQQGCAAWFADQRKKSLLADVGVGTLDQALMAILPVRHQNLRLLGLHTKLLICDEVHAYDSYMSTLLEKLIDAQARSGQSVILLSATLSARQREKLVQAFQRGAHFPPQLPPPLTPADYPWFTQLTQQGFSGSGRVETRNAVQRTVKITWQHHEDECIHLIKKVAEAGGCIGWIRNSVEDAMHIYNRLRHTVAEEDLLLLHSRFAFCDRLAIENKALRWFGKQPAGELPERRGKVLISTQIIESSIDIDLDYMISDLASIDLLIQRAGRLQRHARDASGILSEREGRQPPVFVILAPPWSPEPAPDWLSSAMRNTSFVYPVHLLWLTQRILQQQGEIKMPEAARLLIDAVYGDEVDVPAGLMQQADSKEGKTLSERNAAAQAVIDFSHGYSIAASDLWEEETSTRLAEKTITLYLAYRREGEIVPYGEGEHPWDMSRINVRESWWKQNNHAFTLLSSTELECWEKEHCRPNAQVIILPDDISTCNYSSGVGLKSAG
ncbi:CRISPR-associated helicase Cas3' [Nissabacter archeti]|uniref:CRISPR-associated helicase Cas3 n=1 Tax=Nissabacter archeti TaxID=1917880 RepID=A0ABS5JL92_9GAMM|nr:CRISPR-associated helicase Cas3' [Nissabacter archeti]MBS0970677.1 CRISPR-associated helicase Cas3' [Nissabacter archeti]